MLIKYRWRFILGLLVLLHISIGIFLYISQSQANSALHICPTSDMSAEPDLSLCKPAYPQSQFNISEILFSVIFVPLIVSYTSVLYIFLFGLFIFDKLWHAKRRTSALISLAGTFSIFFLIFSLSLPFTIRNPEQFENVQFGLPLPFIVQNQSYSPEKFPYITHLSSVRETPTRLLWPEFIISFITVTITLFFSLKGFALLLGKRSKKLKS